MNDRIHIRGLRVFGYHGVMPEERREGQMFVIDVDLEVDLAKAGTSDRLEDTVDYAAMATRIHELVSAGRWNLIESVAEHVAALALDEPDVRSVEVAVRKPSAPLTVDVDEVAVRVIRRRG